jgi:hypothetical protein
MVICVRNTQRDGQHPTHTFAEGIDAIWVSSVAECIIMCGWLGKKIGDTFGPIHHQKVVFADDFEHTVGWCTATLRRQPRPGGIDVATY